MQLKISLRRYLWQQEFFFFFQLISSFKEYILNLKEKTLLFCEFFSFMQNDSKKFNVLMFNQIIFISQFYLKLTNESKQTQVCEDFKKVGYNCIINYKIYILKIFKFF